MSVNKQTALLRDILLLYQKYDQRDIASAIRLIESGNALGDLLRLLDTVGKSGISEIGRKSTKARKVKSGLATPRGNLRSFHELLERDESKKFEDVRQFILQIQNRQLLEDAAALREFAAAINIAVSRSKTDRQVVTRKIGELLLRLPAQERDKLYEIARQFSSKTSSLQAWSDIIVKR